MGFIDDIGDGFNWLGSGLKHDFANFGRWIKGKKSNIDTASKWAKGIGGALGVAGAGAMGTGVGAVFTPFLEGGALAFEGLGSLLDSSTSMFDEWIEEDDKKRAEENRLERQRMKEKYALTKEDMKDMSKPLGVIQNTGGTTTPTPSPNPTDSRYRITI